jgi:AcrR family transcriptional regulator
VAFGKVGRPAGDRLERQSEIYRAVSPLILRQGPKGLTMPQAAYAACLGIGGLYHYFPTKRKLILHGLDSSARQRHCDENRMLVAIEAATSLEQGIAAYLDRSVAMLTFARPSVHAAFELGLQGLQEILHPGWGHNVADLTRTVGVFAPDTSTDDRQALALAMRSLAFGFLFDTHVNTDEWKSHARLLIDGCLSRSDIVLQSLYGPVGCWVRRPEPGHHRSPRP